MRTPAVVRAKQQAAELPWRRLVIGLVALLAVFAAGIGLYVNERDAREQILSKGATKTPDRIDVGATVHDTDPESRLVTLRLTADPKGRYVNHSGEPTGDITLITNSPQLEELTFRADSAATPVKDLTVPLRTGTSSDYPFDRYDSRLAVGALIGDRVVPVALHFRDRDPDFAYDVTASDYDTKVAFVDAEVKRSRSTFFMAWFMILAMWAMALSVGIACWLVVGQRRGLQWGALGWMAATLFALVGLRGAAPGSPPNGCVLDYAAFYWAEALIALSVARLVLHGIHFEHRTGGPVDPTVPPGR